MCEVAIRFAGAVISLQMPDTAQIVKEVNSIANSLWIIFYIANSLWNIF